MADVKIAPRADTMDESATMSGAEVPTEVLPEGDSDHVKSGSARANPEPGRFAGNVPQVNSGSVIIDGTHQTPPPMKVETK